MILLQSTSCLRKRRGDFLLSTEVNSFLATWQHDACNPLSEWPGTYVRTRIIDKLVDDFLETAPSQKKQIISLGAGTDTRYFRIISRYAVHEKPNFVYHEIDFAENTARKLTAVKRYGELAGCVRVPASYYSGPDAATETSTIVDSPYYHLHPVDLRTLDQSKEPPCTFRSIDTSLPTVIISECCLVYLTPTAADIVALYFTKHLFPPNTPLGMILYEPINPHDPFGKVMVSNLAARGIVLQTLRKYGSLEAQAVRMKAYGFNDSRGADVNKLWIEGVDEKEKERVAALEMIDEVEEWELLAGHYSVIWGWRNAEADGENGVWERWKAPFS